MRKWVGILGGIVALLFAASILIAIRLEPRVKARLEKLLSDRFDSEVEIGKLSVRLFPRASVTAQQITLRYQHRRDVPPLIAVGEIAANSDLPSLLFGVQHDVTFVKLTGLRITIPPGTLHHSQFEAQAGGSTQPDQGDHLPFVVHKIVADGTVLLILPKKEGREPLEWDIQKLTLTSVGRLRAMKFVATLTNARPPGVIQSSGTFGPWQKKDPGNTAVAGHYTFADADLGIFKGMSGILSSVGDYRGSLDEIDVNGTTDTPNFQVGRGNPVDLKTTFHATVDGTSGDTSLHPVEATFLHSTFLCSGNVVGTPGRKGKKIQLQVAANRSRIEDILLLVVNTKRPPLVGSINLQSKFLLPPGEAPVMDRLSLDGRFGLRSVYFTNGRLQDRLDTLSERSRGIKDKQDQGEVASNMRGRFALKDSIATLRDLSFEVPGIAVLLNGTYGLESEQIDFHGNIRLQGTLSDMATGWKSLLLKAVDPFFRHNGKTVLPIKITGTKSDPKFGLEFHRNKK